MFLLLCVLLLIFYVWRRKKFVDSLPSGPFALPLIGNYFQLNRKDPRKSFLEWQKTYGDIFTVWLGMNPVVVISSADLIKEALVKRGNEFSGRPYFWTIDFFMKGQYGLISNFGKSWVEQRKFTDHTLKQFASKPALMEKKIEDAVGKLIENLEVKLGGSKDIRVDLQKDLELCVGDVLFSIFLGRNIQPNDEAFEKLRKITGQVFKLFGSFRLQLLEHFFPLRFVPLFGRFGYDDLLQQSNDYLDVFLYDLKAYKSNHSNCSNESDPQDFTAAFLTELERRRTTKEDRSNFAEWHLLTNNGDFWLLGFETLVSTLRWSFLLLMLHPNVQEKIQKEIDSVIGTNKRPRFNDSAKLPYTFATIKEIQRLTNILLISVPRAVEEDTVLAGYTLPKGIAVLPQIANFHMDESVFGNADSFKPERFLSSNAKTTSAFMPFGIGTRACPGEILSKMTIFAVITWMLEKYTVSVDDKSPTPTTEAVAEFICKPYVYTCQLRSRKSD